MGSQSPIPDSAGNAAEQVRPSPLRKAAQILASAVLLAAALSFLLFALNLQVNNQRINVDFAIFYTAGKIVSHGNPHQLYNMEIQRQIQQRFVRRNQFRPFYHAPFEAWFFAPFASLSFHAAFLLWSACSLGLFVLVLLLLHRTGYHLGTTSLLAWAAAAVAPLASLFLIGQDSLLLTVVFLLSFLALKRSRDWLAGFLLGLGLFSFQVVLPFVFVFLLRRKFRLLGGFAVSSVLVSAISLATVGLGGIGDYVHVIRTVARPAGDALSGSVASMVSLRALFVTLLQGVVPARVLFVLVVAATLLLLVWAAAQFSAVSRPESVAFNLQFSVCLIAAMIASYHLFQYSLSPLIVAAFLMLAYEDEARRAGSARYRACAILFVLFAVTSIVLGLFHFPQGLVCLVLLALLAWSHREGSRGLAAGRTTEG